MHIYFQKDEKRNVAIQPLLDEIYELKKMKIIIDGTVGRAQCLIVHRSGSDDVIPILNKSIIITNADLDLSIPSPIEISPKSHNYRTRAFLLQDI